MTDSISFSYTVVPFKLNTQNYPQLQNLIRRDPLSYAEEFHTQYQHFQSMLSLLSLSPEDSMNEFITLTNFISHISHCYPKETTQFPLQLSILLKENSHKLHSHIRKSLAQALILLCHRGQLSTKEQRFDLYSLFLELFGCQDKQLRKVIYSFLLKDIQANHSPQMYRILLPLLEQQWNKVSQKSNTLTIINPDISMDQAAKMSLILTMDMYKSNIWNDDRVIAALSEACLATNVKISRPALHFFCEGYRQPSSFDDSDDEDSNNNNDSNTIQQKRRLKHAIQVSGGNKSMERKLKRLSNNTQFKKQATSFHASPFDLIRDPQDFIEKLFQKLKSCSDGFQIKLLMMQLISDLIAWHKLSFSSYYSYLTRYMKPTQKECTKILLYVTQSIDQDSTPKQSIQELVKTLLYYFVAEHCRPEAITVGLNSIREICSRYSDALTTEQLEYIITFKKFKNKGVSMSTRSIISLYRSRQSDQLPSKERKWSRNDSDEYDSDRDNHLDTDVMTRRLLTDKELEILKEQQIELGVNTNIDESDLTLYASKPKASYEQRIQSIKSGRPDRSVYKHAKTKLNPKSSKTNSEKRKNKNFIMLKHKRK